MPEPITISLVFPKGGINKATAYDAQPDDTTPSCLNVWPYQWLKGRARGGVRPGITTTGGTITGIPYNWSPASWDGDYGVAVTTSTGTYVGTKSPSFAWNQRISTNPGSDFSSCAIYNSVLYQASIGSTPTVEGSSPVRARNLNTLASQYNLTADKYLDGSGSKGVAPTNCGLVHADAGRLILSGDYNSPHIIYMSRVNDVRDWDYTMTDPGAAWASSGSTGKINKPIVGLLSHGNDCLLVGHIDGISVIIGNMRGGGQIFQSEQNVGPIMQSAWCKTASDHTVFMSREGLYAIPGGCTRDIRCELISEQLPNDLVGIDPGSSDSCSLCYDGRFHGIHIYVDRAGSGTDAAYFFDLKGRGFFPMSFAAGTMKLGVNFPKLATSTKSGLMALLSGTPSAGSYQFDTGSTENIDSHCYYGPINLGSGLTEGKLVRMTAVLSEDTSQSVTWELYRGQSPQEAFAAASPFFTGTAWTKSGLNHWQYPRMRGGAAYIKVSGTTTNRWCLERIIGEAYPCALLRRGA